MADYRDFRSEKSRDRGSYRKCRVVPCGRCWSRSWCWRWPAWRVWWPPSGTRADGYFSPQFTPDGDAVVVVVRAGPGAGARPRLRDVYAAGPRPGHARSILASCASPSPMVASRPSRPFPPRRLKATGFRPTDRACTAARRRICAGPRPTRSSTRSASRSRVSRPATPMSRAAGGMATKRQWIDSAPWERGYTGMGGDEASQLSGDREVVAVRAGGAMPCAVVIVTKGEATARPILEAAECREAHPDGYDVAALGDVLRRADIERVAHLKAHARGPGRRGARARAVGGRRGARGHPRHAAPGALSEAVDDWSPRAPCRRRRRGGVHDLGPGVSSSVSSTTSARPSIVPERRSRRPATYIDSPRLRHEPADQPVSGRPAGHRVLRPGRWRALADGRGLPVSARDSGSGARRRRVAPDGAPEGAAADWARPACRSCA